MIGGGKDMYMTVYSTIQIGGSSHTILWGGKFNVAE